VEIANNLQSIETFGLVAGLISCREVEGPLPAETPFFLRNALRLVFLKTAKHPGIVPGRASGNFFQGVWAMLRKVIGASLVLVLFVGVAFAEEIRGVITKVDGNKVTFAPLEGKGKDAKKGDEKTLSVADNVKVIETKFNREEKKVEVVGNLEGGLKHKMFDKIGEKGLRATIVTDSDNKKITEIRVTKRMRKKKDQ
jgi:hypothetical protein